MGEVEYNFGRAFHQLGTKLSRVISKAMLKICLGLYSHAVTHYERVLELAEAQTNENEVSLFSFFRAAQRPDLADVERRTTLHEKLRIIFQ